MTRSELYAAIWAEPIPRLAARLGCSDTWLRMICKRLSIPQPPRGFWARVHGRQTVQRPPLPLGEDVDIGRSVHLAALQTGHAAQTNGGEPKQTPTVSTDHEGDLVAVAPPQPTRFVALLEHSLTHRRVHSMGQLSKEAKAWRRHGEISAFLSQLASNVAYRDAPDRPIVLRWIERMRADLEASDPIRECVERVVAFGDSTDSRTTEQQPDSAHGRPQR